jgi:DNA-directed RNA polymerase subunit RPC12/RpoP
MTNTNCLEGLRCPHCGNEDRLLIVATVVAEVTDDGADVASPQYGNGFEWDDDSNTRCPECDRAGPLSGFRV